MTVTFTLTWEEYAEQFEDSWPRRDFFSIIVTALGALFMLIYGIALARAIPDEPIISWIFLGGPFFLIAISAASLVTGTKKRRDRAIAEARSAYERSHTGPQNFSFDGEKWVHETASSKHESWWNSQRITVEKQSIFSLADEGASVLVPKRVLDPEAIRALRKHAFLSCDAGWLFQRGLRDYQAALTRLAWERFHWLIIAGNVLGLAALFWVVKSWLASARHSFALWGWILALAGLVLLLGVQLWYLPLRYLTSARHLHLPLRTKLFDGGICFSGPQVTFFVAWKGLLKFREFRGAFLIFTDQAHFYMLPKHCISPAQQDELRKRLSENFSPIQQEKAG